MSNLTQIENEHESSTEEYNGIVSNIELKLEMSEITEQDFEDMKRGSMDALEHGPWETKVTEQVELNVRVPHGLSHRQEQTIDTDAESLQMVQMLGWWVL